MHTAYNIVAATALASQPVMYGCERVISGRKSAKAVVVAYRSLITGNFEVAVRC